jgi:hypothetical protein
MMNISFLNKGTTRKSTAGQTKESSFALRFASYVKPNGDVVETFSISQTALRKTGLDSVNTAAAAGVDGEGNAIIAVVPASHPNATFLKPATRSANPENKAKSFVVPSLKDALIAQGILSASFAGSQYFDLELAGQDEVGTYFKVVLSEKVAPKAYNPSTDETAENESATM